MGASSYNVWSRKDIAQRIVNGEVLIVYDNHLLKIPPSWLEQHPGGALALLHFVGRDATDEVDAYHSAETIKRIKRYSIGPVEIHANDGGWAPMVPPVMTGWVRNVGGWHQEALESRSNENTELNPSSQILLYKQEDSDTTAAGPTLEQLSLSSTNLSLRIQHQHSAAYKILHKRITDAGLYNTPYLTGYGPEVLSYLLLAALSAFTYYHSWLMTSAVFLGMLWHQLVFTAHDLGHMGVTHNWTADRILGIIIANYIGGLSIGWWVQNHNVHHIVTNHIVHDPDIQHIPFFAISPHFFTNLWSSYYKRTLPFDGFSKFFISIQHKLFYVVMAFARFNLYRLSYVYLTEKAWEPRRARGGKWAWALEVTGIAFFWGWFGAILYGCGSWQKALAYLVVSHVVTSPLHVQIVLSHFTMSTADLGPTESFPHRQLRTTTDVICPPSLAFFHGGLHLQVTHHLFPRLPRHNLKEASLLVKDFAKEEGLTYAEFGFVEGNGVVIGTLKGVAEQVKLMGMVAEAEAKEAVENCLKKKSS